MPPNADPGPERPRAGSPQAGPGAEVGPRRAAPPARTRVERFADHDAFATEASGSGFEMTLTGPESGTWRSAAGILERSSVVFGVEGGANVGHAAIPPHMVVFRVARAGPPPISAGRRLDRSSVAVHGPGAHQFEAVLGPSAWATFAVDRRLVEETGVELGVGGDVVLPGDRRVVTVDRARMAEVRRALARARRTIRHAPATFERPASTTPLQRDLVRAFVGAVGTAGPRGRATATERRRLDVLVASMAYLGATKSHAVTLPELCGVVEASPRTLTRVFQDALCLSPARYLRLRRFGQVRAHLRRGTPRPHTVTSAALRFGFTELGRFSGEYRRLFGESPSDTLRGREGA